jgi:hypothetical protein
MQLKNSIPNHFFLQDKTGKKIKFRKFSKVRKIEIKILRINLIEKQKEDEIIKVKSI